MSWIRMEIACFLVLVFMAIMYFTAKRENTQVHKVFSGMLVLSLIHTVLDGVTVYTVNHLESIPLWVNDVLHRLFLGTMSCIFYLVYAYIVLLVEDETKDCLRIAGFARKILIVFLICVAVAPLYYVETANGNYSYGPAVFLIYVSLLVFLLLAAITLCRHWKQIHRKKKMGVSLALGIQVLVLGIQAAYPLTLISAMGIMLINLAIYMTMENPDIALVEQVRQEKQKADEANAAKSAFLSNMSHEIRTPMNAIVGMTEILLRTDLTEEQKEYLENIKSAGTALVSIINDILDISKIEAGRMELVEDVYEPAPMFHNIRVIIQNRIGSRPVELKYEIDEKLPAKLYGDGLRIRQVIINLMNNAVKFTEEGYIKLSVQEEKRTEDEIFLHVSVQDTGQGIKEEDFQKLFEKFSQVDVRKNKGKEGTGLGLSISGQLVRMMGGEIKVRSEYGKGSEFYFTIPQKLVSGELELNQGKQEKEFNFTAPDANILIVDDNEMNLKVAAGLAAPFQMNIDTAKSGKEALAMTESKKYDIIFMDHMMPGMDGVEATMHIRERKDSYFGQVPVIALTANAMPEARKLFEKAGMNAFLAKPIDMRELSLTLQKWLPKELIQKQEIPDHTEKQDTDTIKTDTVSLPGIDTAEGIKNCGSQDMFEQMLGDFYKLIDVKATKIEKCLADEMRKDYTIEVHALKSTARMIGAMELSGKFAHLETLGNEGTIEAMKSQTPSVLALYRNYKPILKPYGTKQDAGKREASQEEILLYLNGIQEAVDAFDLDETDAAFSKLEECILPEEWDAWMEELRADVADVAMEDILTVTQKMIDTFQQEQAE